MRRLAAMLFGLVVVAGCSTEREKTSNPNKALSETDQAYEDEQVPRIRESFERMKEAMLKGDTKTYFALLSSRQQTSYGGYDGFVRSFTVRQNSWREMWRGAEIRMIAIDERAKEKASVLVRWSTPAPHVLEFILEDGTWRLHYVVPERT